MKLIEIFTRVVTGLASQGFERSTNGNGCLYRNASGRKCAAGWLIPDGEYSPKYENYGVIDLCANSNAPPSIQCLSSEELRFVAALQTAHDLGYTPDGMKNRLRGVARTYELPILAALL